MASGDDSYKLPLRQWLVKQIDSRNYLGLEWESPDKKNFRLPWEKKHGVDWKDKHKLFEAWAIHRKGSGYTTQDPSKLKANFRSALNKSESFEEVTCKNQLQNQSGNYKVYKILSPQEVEEKKRNNLKRKKGNSGQVNVSSSNYNSLEIQPKKERVASPMNQYSNHNGYNNYNGVETENHNGITNVQNDYSGPYVEMSPFSANHSNWLDDGNDMLLRNEFTLAGPSPPLDASSWQDQSLHIKMDTTQPVGGAGFTPDPFLMTPTNNNLTTINASAIQQSSDSVQLDSKDLESFYSVLPLFDIGIYYDGVIQNEHLRFDLSQGLRMHYGAKKDSKTGVVIKQYHPSVVSGPESCYGLNLPDIEFPRRAADKTYLTQILEGLRLGFKIQYNNLKLSVTRFCQTHIFIANSEPFKKIERQTPTVAFAVDEYLKKWNNNNNTCCLWLACGIKPKKVSFEPEKGVWVKLKPCIADLCTGEQMASMQQSICMSNMNELELILKSVNISSDQTPSTSTK